MIHQLSVFLENRSGRLAEITRILGEVGIDIRALSIADTTDFGILRLIVNDPDKAVKSLRDSGFTAVVTEVMAVRMTDAPGALYGVLSILTQAGYSIEYAYAFITRNKDDAFVILRVEDVQGATRLLAENGVPMLAPEDVYTV